jgi:outer membrane lipoprotein-sorting protein
VKLLRTLPTSRLIAIVAIVFVVAVGGATVAVAASGGGGSTPPAKPLANAIHDALAATAPKGVTARITFTNRLFPSGALVGATGSALMSGATGRLWANDTGGRLELQSNAGDVQVTWNDTTVTVYDASSNTAYTFDLPKQNAATTPTTAHDVPSLEQITTFLTDLSQHWTVSGAEPSNVAGEQAYTVKISPSHDGGLLGSAQLAWDAVNGVPLRVAIYAQGASSPALALEARDISFGDVASSDVNVAPPAGAKKVDLSSQTTTGKDHGTEGKPITGLSAVQAAAGFTVTAPDTLVGLPRQDVRLVGPKDAPAALVTYGQGLGAIVVVERAKDAKATDGVSTALGSLPTVSVGGVTGHELATQLGTILTWDRDSVTFVLAGSVPNGAAETAAAGLR